jgi:hypothetical protein
MKTPGLVLIAVIGAGIAHPAGVFAQETPAYLRGDSNGSGSVDISDGLHLLNFLFTGGAAPRCRAEADANRSGALDISDALALFNFLFTGGDALPEMTEEEASTCASPRVVRSGTLIGILPHVNEEHGVRGIVEQLSNRTIRIREFHYDGGGGGRTYVWLHRGGDLRIGQPISPNIRKPYPGFLNETIEYSIPEGITDDTFHSVAIWCYDFDQNFGSARLVAPSP